MTQDYNVFNHIDKNTVINHV